MSDYTPGWSVNFPEPHGDRYVSPSTGPRREMPGVCYECGEPVEYLSAFDATCGEPTCREQAMLRDASGRAVAPEADNTLPTRPDGPWNSNGRQR